MGVLPTGPAQVDVGLLDGRIAAIGDPGTITAAQVVDAKDTILLPGGIDPHVHIGTRFGSWTTKDDFHSGTVGAALGGTTTIIEFAIPEPDETSGGALDRRLDLARSKAVVDPCASLLRAHMLVDCKHAAVRRR